VDINEKIRAGLLNLKDINYKEFHSKLVPTLDKDRIIGIRTPILRKYSNEISQTKHINIFLNTLPHYYYEENNLHAFCIEKIKDYRNCIEMLDKFLPYIDNWATCDSMSPPILSKHKDLLIEQIKIWLNSSHTYTVRFGLKCLMTHYLDADFKEEYLIMASNIKSSEYYIQMMIAWFFATALAKQYETTISYITDNKLDLWIHNKTIQKALESYRITEERKLYLKTLKRKG